MHRGIVHGALAQEYDALFGTICVAIAYLGVVRFCNSTWNIVWKLLSPDSTKPSPLKLKFQFRAELAVVTVSRSSAVLSLLSAIHTKGLRCSDDSRTLLTLVETGLEVASIPLLSVCVGLFVH